jgi:class 3 adenylate cyclase
VNDDRDVEATFCFVDIAGYTALTETHGERAAADLVDAFGTLVREAIRDRGELQSMTGDCAFITFPAPLDALAALSALYGAIADRRDFPVVRTGLHHGIALHRGSRLFGTAVNLAARVAAQATGGQILCTGPVAQALAGAGPDVLNVRHRGRVALRNLPEPVDLFDVVLSDCARQYAIDPVCKMQVDTRDAAGDLRVGGQTYWFCSLECVERFAHQPGAYVALPAD